MLTKEKLELSDQEFNDLYAAHEKGRTTVKVDKKILGKLLRDHSQLHAELKF